MNGAGKSDRPTVRERLQAKLGQVKTELRRRLHDPVPEVGSWLRSVVGGHVRYYGVPTNSRRQCRRWVLRAVSRGRGSGTARVAWKDVGGLAIDRAGATDSYGGGEGDGVRGVA